MEELINRDLPTFHRTLLDVKEGAEAMTKELKQKLERMREGGDRELNTAAGVSLLDVKNLAMMQYMCDVIGVIKCKTSGESLASTGFVERTVESRTVLEKIRPLEKKIAYQIDKIVTDGATAGALNHAPDVGDLAPSDDDDDEEGSEDEEAVDNEDGDINDIDTSTQKYVPPHISMMQYNERKESQSMRKEREHMRAIQRSSVIADLVEDATDAPMEISNYADGNDRKKVVRQRSERKKYEEDNFTRIRLTKKEKNREVQTMRRSALDTITHFGSDFYSNDSTARSGGSGGAGGGKSKGKKRGAKGKKGGGGGKRRRH